MGARTRPSGNRHRHRPGRGASRRPRLLRCYSVQIPGDWEEHPARGDRLLPREIRQQGVPTPCLDRHNWSSLVPQRGRDAAPTGEAGASDRSALSQGKLHRLGCIRRFWRSWRARTPEEPAAAPAGGDRERPCAFRHPRHARQAADGLRHREDACRAPYRRAYLGRRRTRSRASAELGASLPDPAGLARRRHAADPRLCCLL